MIYDSDIGQCDITIDGQTEKNQDQNETKRNFQFHNKCQTSTKIPLFFSSTFYFEILKFLKTPFKVKKLKIFFYC